VAASDPSHYFGGVPTGEVEIPTMGRWGLALLLLLLALVGALKVGVAR
jgi:hypothetical protein